MRSRIPNPIAHDRLKVLYQDLYGRGCRIQFYCDPDLPGRAFSERSTGAIVFKNQKTIAQASIAHELHHLKLIWIDGYPFVESTGLRSDRPIISLNDMFQHIMIDPGMKALGFSIYDCEAPGVISGVDKLPAFIAWDGMSLDDRRAVVNLFYINARALGIPEPSLSTIERTLRVGRLWDEELILFVSQRLPNPTTDKVEYKLRLESCLSKLRLEGGVRWS